MAIRKHGTGKILEEGKENPDPIVKQAASQEWTEKDAEELRRENEQG